MHGGTEPETGLYWAELQISVKNSYYNTRVKQALHTCIRPVASCKFLLERGTVDGTGETPGGGTGGITGLTTLPSFGSNTSGISIH